MRVGDPGSASLRTALHHGARDRALTCQQFGLHPLKGRGLGPARGGARHSLRHSDRYRPPAAAHDAAAHHHPGSRSRLEYRRLGSRSRPLDSASASPRCPHSVTDGRTDRGGGSSRRLWGSRVRLVPTRSPDGGSPRVPRVRGLLLLVVLAVLHVGETRTIPQSA